MDHEHILRMEEVGVCENNGFMGNVYAVHSVTRMKTIPKAASHSLIVCIVFGRLIRIANYTLSFSQSSIKHMT